MSDLVPAPCQYLTQTPEVFLQLLVRLQMLFCGDDPFAQNIFYMGWIEPFVHLALGCDPADLVDRWILGALCMVAVLRKEEGAVCEEHLEIVL